MRILPITALAAFSVIGVLGCGDHDSHKSPGKVGEGDSAYQLDPPLGERETFRNSIGVKLKLVQPGRFMMGSPESDESARDNEKPPRTATIARPFYLGAFEVTQRQYEQVMGVNPSLLADDPLCPVDSVSWEDAREFCQRLSDLPEEKSLGAVYRLPTEEEWEYACRSESDTRYCFSDLADDLGQYAWYRDNSGMRSHGVGQQQPNAWGFYDMHGNVQEWCQDHYDSRETDPLRVVRGGGAGDTAGRQGSAVRSAWLPNTGSHAIGFRVVLDLPEHGAGED